MENYILNRGGYLFTNADVKEIIIKDNKTVGVKVKYLNDLIEIKCPIVVSSVGLIHTYDLLSNVLFLILD